MDEAKTAIKDLTSRHGHHDTTVHEHHKPTVTHEHVTPTRHDEGTTVVDREIHQDHYHTNVQPIHHREVLPEEHKHKMLPTETKEFHHGDSAALKQRLAGDAAKFRDASETGATQYTRSTNPEVGGEHVHHHIHETIQPVVQKETIQPTVVHTTNPIHEVHHNAAQHHSSTVLPAVNLADFERKGGSLTGAKDRVTHYEGEPGQSGLMGDSHGGTRHTGGVVAAERGAPGVATTTGGGPTGRVTNNEPILHRERGHDGHAGATVDSTGNLEPDRSKSHTHGSAATDPRVDSRKGDLPIAQEYIGHGGAGAVGGDRIGHKNASAATGDRALHPGSTHEPPAGQRHKNGSTATEDRALHPGSKHEPPASQFADTHLGAGKSGNTTGVSNFESANIRHGEHEEKKKPSILDKLNPLKDADGDGKKGIMN